MTVPTFPIRSRYIPHAEAGENLCKSMARVRILNPLRLPFRHSGQPFNYNRLGGEGKARKARFRRRFRHSRFRPVLFCARFFCTYPLAITPNGRILRA